MFLSEHSAFGSSCPAQVRSLCCSLSGFCTGRYSKWSWSGVFPLLQVSLFLQFKRIIPALRRALRCACVALIDIGGSLVPLQQPQ